MDLQPHQPQTGRLPTSQQLLVTLVILCGIVFSNWSTDLQAQDESAEPTISAAATLNDLNLVLTLGTQIEYRTNALQNLLRRFDDGPHVFEILKNEIKQRIPQFCHLVQDNGLNSSLSANLLTFIWLLVVHDIVPAERVIDQLTETRRPLGIVARHSHVPLVDLIVNSLEFANTNIREVTKSTLWAIVLLGELTFHEVKSDRGPGTAARDLDRVAHLASANTAFVQTCRTNPLGSAAYSSILFVSNIIKSADELSLPALQQAVINRVDAPLQGHPYAYLVHTLTSRRALDFFAARFPHIGDSFARDLLAPEFAQPLQASLIYFLRRLEPRLPPLSALEIRELRTLFELALMRHQQTEAERDRNRILAHVFNKRLLQRRYFYRQFLGSPRAEEQVAILRTLNDMIDDAHLRSGASENVFAIIDDRVNFHSLIERLPTQEKKIKALAEIFRTLAYIIRFDEISARPLAVINSILPLFGTAAIQGCLTEYGKMLFDNPRFDEIEAADVPFDVRGIESILRAQGHFLRVIDTIFLNNGASSELDTIATALTSTKEQIIGTTLATADYIERLLPADQQEVSVQTFELRQLRSFHLQLRSLVVSIFHRVHTRQNRGRLVVLDADDIIEAIVTLLTFTSTRVQPLHRGADFRDVQESLWHNLARQLYRHPDREEKAKTVVGRLAPFYHIDRELGADQVRGHLLLASGLQDGSQDLHRFCTLIGVQRAIKGDQNSSFSTIPKIVAAEQFTRTEQVWSFARRHGLPHGVRFLRLNLARMTPR